MIACGTAESPCHALPFSAHTREHVMTRQEIIAMRKKITTADCEHKSCSQCGAAPFIPCDYSRHAF